MIQRGDKLRKLLSVGSIAFLVGLIILAIGIVKQKQNLAAERSLVDVYQQLKLGEELRYVEEVVKKYPSLRIRNWGTRDSHGAFTLVEVSTPLSIGAKNWKIVILLDGDSTAAFGVRTSDSRFEKPVGSPEDRVLPKTANVWDTNYGRTLRDKSNGEASRGVKVGIRDSTGSKGTEVIFDSLVSGLS